MRPYPHFGSVSLDDNTGYSWYHSLQVRADKRFSHGVTFQAAYTFSKLMQATEYLNAGDARPYESLALVDRPHLVSLTGLFELPFGRGRRFGADIPRVGDIGRLSCGGIHLEVWGRVAILSGFVGLVRHDARRKYTAINCLLQPNFNHHFNVLNVLERSYKRNRINALRVLPGRTYARAEPLHTRVRFVAQSGLREFANTGGLIFKPRSSITRVTV